MIKRGLVSALLAFIFLLNCKSPHKLAGTDFTPVGPTASTAQIQANYPQAIVDSLGWMDLTTGKLNRKEREIIRLWSVEGNKPTYMYNIVKTKKRVKGESVIYWSLNGPDKNATHKRWLVYFRDTCKDIFKLENYGYCIPLYNKEPKWDRLYTQLEQNNVWKIKAGDDLSDEGLNVQLRLEDKYFRTYSTDADFLKPDSLSTKSKVVNIEGSLNSQLSNYKKNQTSRAYRGVTKGTPGSSFIPCDYEEVWRFDGNAEEILKSRGIQINISDSDSSYFFAEVDGILNDNLSSYNSESKFSHVLTIYDVGQFSPVIGRECPDKKMSN